MSTDQEFLARMLKRNRESTESVNLTHDEMKAITRALFASKEPLAQSIVSRFVEILKKEK